MSRWLQIAASTAAVLCLLPATRALGDVEQKGSPVSTSTITNPLVALPDAGSALFLRYGSTSVRGEPVVLTASVLLPRTPPPPDGWPLVVWNHMTTGAADTCAPTAARQDSTALADMTSGDRIVGRLLRAGVAVARPDYEGIGSPGPHPYLIGASLARSVIDVAHAIARLDPRIGRDVAVAGHSEGAVASLFAAAAGQSEWSPLRLRSVAAIGPPTRVAELIGAAAEVPVRAGSATGDLTGLAALLIAGAATVEPDFHSLVTRDDGLSPRATELMELVDEVCYRELSSARAFGSLAPRELLGPAGHRTKRLLMHIADANDVAHLSLARRLPVRLDAGDRDLVAPRPLVAALASHYRAAGADVTFASHAAGHSEIPRGGTAARDITTWIVDTLAR